MWSDDGKLSTYNPSFSGMLKAKVHGFKLDEKITNYFFYFSMYQTRVLEDMVCN
jgi:hypothetical protein